MRSLQQLAQDAVARGITTRQFASELYHLHKPLGIFDDWDRVARTLMQELAGQQALERQANRPDTTSDTFLFRSLAAVPCNGCLWLARDEEGRPRLYTLAEFQAGDRLGRNRGPWWTWHVRSGVCHPNCVCPGVMRWHVVMRRIHEESAAQWKEAYTRRKIIERVARGVRRRMVAAIHAGTAPCVAREAFSEATPMHLLLQYAALDIQRAREAAAGIADPLDAAHGLTALGPDPDLVAVVSRRYLERSRIGPEPPREIEPIVIRIPVRT